MWRGCGAQRAARTPADARTSEHLERANGEDVHATRPGNLLGTERAGRVTEKEVRTLHGVRGHQLSPVKSGRKRRRSELQ